MKKPNVSKKEIVLANGDNAVRCPKCGGQLKQDSDVLDLDYGPVVRWAYCERQDDGACDFTCNVEWSDEVGDFVPIVVNKRLNEVLNERSSEKE